MNIGQSHTLAAVRWSMTSCFRCGNDRSAVTGCERTRTLTFADGLSRHPILYGDERWVTDATACPDCHASPGAYHHPGCTVEACPKCHHHYTRCECDTKEKRRLDGNHDIEL